MHQRMQQWIDREVLSCCETVVLRGTDIIDHARFGYMDCETKRGLQPDAIWRMYSNTKMVTSVALMQQVERGRIGLDDPIARYIPAFANPRVLRADATSAGDTEPARSPITVRHVLSHSAGFSYGFIEPTALIDQIYIGSGLNILSDFSITLEELCNRLATLPLAYHPGTDWRYSLATDVCARLCEVVSGSRFDQLLEAEVFAPLGMVDTGFHVPADKAHRFITMYAGTDMLDPVKPGLVKADDPHTGQYNQPRTLLSGGGGLVSTMSDFLSFIRMIVAEGTWNGARILAPQTLALMRQNQLAPGVGVRFPMWAMPGTAFGLGFALKEQVSADEPARALGEYHWGGMAGTHTWMAPAAGITGLCFTQRMPGFWHPFSHEFRSYAYALTE